MKNLMLSTAIMAGISSALLGAPTFAQDAATTGMFRPSANAMDLRASNFIGMRVYASDAAIDADAYDGAQDGWNDIGEVNDVILSRDGKVDAVLVDIGGFLGMGERQVAVGMEALRFVQDSATADNEADFFLVMTATRGDLEGAPAYTMGDAAADGTVADGTVADGAAADGTVADGAATGDAAMTTEGTATGDAAMTTDGTAPAVVPGETTTQTTEAAPGAARTPIVRDGYTAAEADYLTSEKLTGAKVYDANDTWIGEVGTLVLTDDGKTSQAIIDVGGFLGMGEKPVALNIADIDILRNEAGDDVRVYVSKTKQDLEAMPKFEG